MVTGRKLLLADDSVTIQKVVDLTFKDEGLEVVTVSDGRLALEKLDEFTPDIVLADVFMPRVNGYEVCEYIKQNERFRHIPVMLLVGSFEPFDEAEARRVGADDYLTKPFQSIRTLISKVSNLLSGGRRESEEAVTRQLPPPPAAEKENRSGTDFLERSTADTAPLPEVHEERESHQPSREVSFADISMDDEMIETTPARDYASAGQSTQTRPTAQYSTADLRDAGIRQAVESAPEPVEETVGAFASGQVDEPSAVAANQSQAATGIAGLAASEDSLLDLGEMEPPPPAMAEADDFFLDLLDETPQSAPKSASAGAETSASSFEAAQFPAIPAAERNASAPFKQEEEVGDTHPQAQEFAEAQIIGEEGTKSAPIEDEESAATEDEPRQEGTQQNFPPDLQSAPTERLPDDYQFEEAARVSTPTETAPQAAAGSTPRAGQITLEQLSPEVIDAIARRAVEQLSARVVEEIAWEVVPELAELLIKHRLEEGKQ